MEIKDILLKYQESKKHQEISEALASEQSKVFLKGGTIGLLSFYLSAQIIENKGTHLIILNDKEKAAYVYNDLVMLAQSMYKPLFFPESYKVPYHPEAVDNANISMRAEVLNQLNSRQQRKLIVTYPDALAEKVITRSVLKKNTLIIEKNEAYSIDFINELLIEYEFEKVDYVYEPGQFSVRGGIVDVFSFSNDFPFRLEFFGDEVESIRTFNPTDQLSVKQLEKIEVVPNIQNHFREETYISLFDFNPSQLVVWAEDIALTSERIKKAFTKAEEQYNKLESPVEHRPPDELYMEPSLFNDQIEALKVVEYGLQKHFDKSEILQIN